MTNKIFGRYYPVIVDCETSGCDPNHHAILELAYSFIKVEESSIVLGKSETFHLLPFENAQFDPKSMDIHKIDPYYPLRFAEPEKDILKQFKTIIQREAHHHGYERAILVGHNSWFDLAFINAAFSRSSIKSPFHRFTSIDTATLAGFFFKETVLAKALQKAKICYDAKQAHGALYDAMKTAELYCHFWNKFNSLETKEK